MSKPGMRRCIMAAGIAAALALGSVGPGAAVELHTGGVVKAERAGTRAGPRIAARWRGIMARWGRLAPGILPDVPSGGDPFLARPLVYPLPPPVVVAPALLVPPVWAPPIILPSVVLAPPLYDVAPIYFEPIDFAPCFVPSEHTAQFGHYGSCAESYFRQLTNEPD